MSLLFLSADNRYQGSGKQGLSGVHGGTPGLAGKVSAARGGL